jgi:hypothetical protein
MRFLLIIAIASITFIGCKKASGVSENPSQDSNTEITTSKIEETKLLVSDEAEAIKTEIAEAIEEEKSKAPTKRPKIKFGQKSFDYGMIEQGDKIDHEFTFTNTGDADLIIKNAQASCGCTTPSYPFIPIKPGKTGVINVTFSSVGKMGTQHPTITVTSNAYPRVTTLTLEGFVTDKLAKKKAAIIEENVEIDPEGNTSKDGEDIEADNQ